jgi:uncharacterized protein YndB with AHSA1/START domain
MADWLSPRGHAEAEVDVRIGGSFRIVMVHSDTQIEHTGTYLELDPPRRLVFTWISPYTGPDPSVVTVELQPAGAGTRLVLTHERLPGDVVDGHRNGWAAMLERLAEALAREEEPR